ncbi:hypothetical protein FSARC_11289 [Fusarium sarcochroum]|uniref:Uncharacterized protein n=1 Tax=Fusarium sarcochroum TaxID=1208366 RepID=A0A8H4TGE7_9HYPO|nr:hypothetical protein FSARC_11289 [Fusarium sarcochroum]
MTLFLTMHQIRSSYRPISPRLFTYHHGLLRQAEEKPISTPSPQQIKIAQLCAEQNVVISAWSGPGKIATIEAIAAAHPDKKIGVFLFYQRLQNEISRRLKKCTNCHVSTFYDMASTLFGPGVVVSNNEILRRLVENAKDAEELPQWTSTPFDIIVLNEIQHFKLTTFSLVEYLIRSSNLKKQGQPARVVVLGDERQPIDRSLRTEPRYLTLAPKLLQWMSPYPFAKFRLEENVPMPKPTVDFVNRVFLGGEELTTSSEHGPKPVVLRCYPWGSDALAEKLIPLIHRYGPENCAIIAPNVLKRSPVRYLANTLAQQHGIPISVPTNEETSLDDTVIKGKVCISTIHQFKDRKRDLIIVFGMDASFFKRTRPDLPADKCPSEALVAVTRALKQLVLVHDDNKKLMPFVSVDDLYETAEVVDMTNSQARIAPPNTSGRPLDFRLKLPATCEVHDMTRYIRTDSLWKLVNQHLRHERVSGELSPDEFLNIPSVIPSDLENGLYESVSEINGLVLVSALELENAGTLYTLGLNKSDIDENPPASLWELSPWLCRHACEHEARLSGYMPRVIQMKNHKFDWIEPRILELAQRRFRERAGSATFQKFAFEMTKWFNVGTERTQIKGRANIIATSPSSDSDDGTNNQTIWEMKYASHLSEKHIVQACVNAYLMFRTTKMLPQIILYNIRTGEKREITPLGGSQGLHEFITDLMYLRYKPVGGTKDELFIGLCKTITKQVLNMK